MRQQHCRAEHEHCASKAPKESDGAAIKEDLGLEPIFMVTQLQLSNSRGTRRGGSTDEERGAASVRSLLNRSVKSH